MSGQHLFMWLFLTCERIPRCSQESQSMPVRPRDASKTLQPIIKEQRILKNLRVDTLNWCCNLITPVGMLINSLLISPVQFNYQGNWWAGNRWLADGLHQRRSLAVVSRDGVGAAWLATPPHVVTSAVTSSVVEIALNFESMAELIASKTERQRFQSSRGCLLVGLLRMTLAAC